MSILGSNKLLQMSLTVKELSNKHQLNPKNTGVTPIDQVIWYNNVNSEIGIGNLLRISTQGQVYEMYRITSTNFKPFYISKDCYIYTDCGMKSIETGLAAPQRIVVYNKRSKCLKTHTIIDIEQVHTNDTIHTVCSDRKLLILSNGVIVMSD